MELENIYKLYQFYKRKNNIRTVDIIKNQNLTQIYSYQKKIKNGDIKLKQLIILLNVVGLKLEIVEN